MAGFEDIPEEKEESYPCPNCPNGNVSRWEGGWQCDTCDWMPALRKEDVD